jgi:hypothetical protein
LMSSTWSTLSEEFWRLDASGDVLDKTSEQRSECVA